MPILYKLQRAFHWLIQLFAQSSEWKDISNSEESGGHEYQIKNL